MKRKKGKNKTKKKIKKRQKIEKIMAKVKPRSNKNKSQKHSAESMISPEVLKASFVEAIQAIEDVSTYKQQALPQMKETIMLFSDLANDGQKVVEKIETTNTDLLN